MFKKIASVPLIIVGILFIGCASSGRQFSTTHVNDIQIGVQDKQTITDWFGKPLTITNLSNNPKGCVERWIYTYAKAVGFGNVTESNSLVVDFNSNGKVCDQAYVKQK
jgi:outer membrane protein assembly factor BamE (lipoprotein component of BamABCDE complex)